MSGTREISSSAIVANSATGGQCRSRTSRSQSPDTKSNTASTCARVASVCRRTGPADIGLVRLHVAKRRDTVGFGDQFKFAKLPQLTQQE